jgi:hypothetical protein
MTAGVGPNELRTNVTLTQKDGKIQYIEFKPSAEDDAAMHQANDKLWAWIQAERNAEWKAVTTPASSLPARERGKLLAQLCREYVEAHK